jgi:metallo-beta-lactamase family protein
VSAKHGQQAADQPGAKAEQAQTLRCLGAAGEVTGSCHLVSFGPWRILLECGMFQGSREEEARNLDPFEFDVAAIDAVILSHAHIDHSGRLPLLVKRGYRGPIYAHAATRDLCEIMLADAAFLNERDAEWENRRRELKGQQPIEPLYTVADATVALRQFRTLPYDRVETILAGVKLRFQDAGHILGSAIVELWLSEAGRADRKIVFSGDLGQSSAPILRDPSRIEEADLVLMESTYGDRLHRSWAATNDELTQVIAQAESAQGNILIPAFAVGRTQMILYWMSRNFAEAGLSRWRIFLDSPMAIKATIAYARHADLHDEHAAALWRQAQDQPLLPNLRLVETAEQSKALNQVQSGAIIIAGSGMCTGGRIRHHLLHNVWREECHIMMLGFQARGTTGRALIDGAAYIRLWGEEVRVAAKIHTIGGLSAHADQQDLIDWYKGFHGHPELMLVHGERDAQEALVRKLSKDLGVRAQIANRERVLDLDELPRRRS